MSPEHETPVTQASEEPRGSEGDQEIPATDLDDDGVKHEGRITADAVERQTASPLPLPEHQEPQSPRASNNEGTPIIEESKNWLDLPMLEKLDSMHLVTEWQFHNPLRVRTLMKDDDEGASWVSFAARKSLRHLISLVFHRGLSPLATTRRVMLTG